MIYIFSMIKTQTPTVDLPTDVSTLQAMVLQLLSDAEERNRQIDDLQRQLEWFKRHVFGRRSEKLSPNQLTLFQGIARDQCEDGERDAASEGSNNGLVGSPGKHKKHPNGRRPLPEDLPRERIEYLPSQKDMICPCCGQARQPIGEEVTEELDYVPASFVVRQHVRIKYACKHCQEGVAIADLPARPIEKGRPGSGLLANVLTSKYSDHLPLHRQEGIWKRHGVHIMRSTMCDWVRDCADLLLPIVHYMHTIILQSKKIHTDDTPVPVQDGSRKQTRKGYLWTYIGDKNDVVFDYTPTHSRDGPVAFLGDYSGYVHADAYKGYDAFFEKGNATEVACWAHTPRKFFDSLTTDPRRAHIMLAMIGKLYEVEQQAKEEALKAIALRELRQEQSKPVLEEIGGCLDDWSIEVLPKSPIGQAVGYARGQWIALNQYTRDGDLDIDNNLAERVLRIVAVGRKNWLFAGSDAGAERAAVIYSLISSCKLCEIDPFTYLRDVLDRVSTHPASRIAELTPSGWES